MLKDGERLDDLEYNNLKIIQHPDGYCFTSDSVLISNLVNVKKTDKVVDLCTGSGVIAMLVGAKFCPRKVVGVELQERLANMAKRSVEYNNMCHQIEIINANVIGVEKLIGSGAFDVVVANPPYDTAEIKQEYSEIEICRKEAFLSIEQLIVSADKLLKFGGLCYIINKTDRLIDVLYYMRLHKIEPKKIYFIQPKTSKDMHTFVVEGKKGGKQGLVVPPPIVVYNQDNSYTDFSRRLYNK